MERIQRKGERPVYQPQITREACHALWEIGQWRGQYLTVVLNEIIYEAHIVEDLLREEALVESGYAPTVFVRPPGEEEYRPVLPAERQI